MLANGEYPLREVIITKCREQYFLATKFLKLNLEKIIAFGNTKTGTGLSRCGPILPCLGFLFCVKPKKKYIIILRFCTGEPVCAVLFHMKSYIQFKFKILNI